MCCSCFTQSLTILLYITSFTCIGIPIYILSSNYNNIQCTKIENGLIASICIHSAYFVNLIFLKCINDKIYNCIKWFLLLGFAICSAYYSYIYYKINDLCSNDYFDNNNDLIYWSYTLLAGVLILNTVLYLYNIILYSSCRRKGKYSLYDEGEYSDQLLGN